MTALSLKRKIDDSNRQKSVSQLQYERAPVVHCLPALCCDEILGKIAIVATPCCTTAAL
jgi:hypothetical protein